MNETSSNKQMAISNPNQLKILQVFDRLEIGPVKLEKNKLVAPYTVWQDGEKDQIDLIYKFEEPVFHTEEAASINLACMMAAQVAINYGLFCKTVVFRGLYSDQDKKFIQEAMENTAREIYVKKFLEPNLFLTGEAARLEYFRAASYNQAVVEFKEDAVDPHTVKWQLWITQKSNHAVLSSGGKDSLLTFGILNELEKPVFPIFINESGRHWFTALNAYRHFKTDVRNTKRVWTNSDRVFNWMVRHMPFIRRDYASIRADEYPIRLWTVAVFLFGALPLLRKYKIGRLLIGDEYDTTVRTTYKGITHYDGLYDQSRYFDNYLSRYFLKKGWSISQFSILRTLSELLIEKILVERYPHLQKHQTSCHAAHKSGDRIYPCGKCEKCRRIVAMMTALDADPGGCGYSKEQIDRSLSDLVEMELHQEAAVVQQLYFSLEKKGLIRKSDYKKNLIKEHPEVLKLRFDPERAPIHSIPKDLREPVYKIFSAHAAGAVVRSGRKWLDYDPLADPDLTRDYAFEVDSRPSDRKEYSENPEFNPSFYWGEMNWPEADKRLSEVDVALLPVGAIEQHGPHLPLDTDAFDAEYLAGKVAEACSRPAPLVLPLISYGVSYHHDDFKGTISISNDTLAQLVYEIGMSAAKNGIKKLLIINAHGGNDPALNYAAQMINRDARIFVAVDTGETSDIDIEALTETPNDVHAGEIETSTALATRAHLVKLDAATKFVPNFSSRYLNFSSKRGISWHAYTKRISASGVMGDPTKANMEKGQKMWQIMIAHLVVLVEDLKSMTLDELYQKRY